MKKSQLASFSRLARLEYRRPRLQQCDFENPVEPYKVSACAGLFVR